ncbi:MAG: recombination protein O N-terminal domain-containing protein [Candidatus Brennerbacteria bacterium]|nr:recombination protein O N-terminal domain-containing protein [Candidatus Brennerbacteria bacterium]
MREYFAEAVVLGLKPSGAQDRIVNLYTKDLGRLTARVVGGRKITSKLSPHLEQGNLVEARLVEKSRFVLADAVLKKRFGRSSAVFEALFLLNSLLPELVPDLRLWHGLLRGLEKGKPDKKIFLKLMGYNTLLAKCENCGRAPVDYFRTADQIFLCRSCFTSSPGGHRPAETISL